MKSAICYAVFMTETSYDFVFTRKRELKKKILFIALIFMAILLCLQLIFRFIICPVVVLSSGMEPAVSKNAAVFVQPLFQSKMEMLNVASAKRGEIVRVRLLSEPPKLNFFKKALALAVRMISFQKVQLFEKSLAVYPAQGIFRLIGLPKDTLYIKDSVAYIKPYGSVHFLTEFELSETDYTITAEGVPAVWDSAMGIQSSTDSIVLRENEYFVLSDNRISSADSRLFGVLTQDRISGKALLQYYPFNKIKKLY